MAAPATTPLNFSATDKAQVLVESLPYIKKFRGKTIVVKYGGSAMDDERARRRFCADIVLLKYVGIHPVVVHGGGPQIGQMLKRLGVESRFVGGLRVTDDATMRVVEMVLGGEVNQDLVRLIGQAGGRAVGLTGKDGGLVTARRLGTSPGESDLGRVGEVETVDPKILEKLCADDFIPVIAPIGVDADGESLNINADPFAAKIAAAMRAEKLVLLTDVQGVKAADGTMFSSLKRSQVEALIASQVITGGMIPKVRFGLDALADGVPKVHILSGALDHAVLLEIFTDQGIGTELTA